jgi:uncharacterized protein YdcH (DUF465 family)
MHILICNFPINIPFPHKNKSLFCFVNLLLKPKFRAFHALRNNIFFRRKEEILKEQEIVENLKQGSEEFRKLMEEHHNLEGILAEIDKKVYLTPEEEIERKKVQKQKLLKKDRMAELIREFKKNGGSSLN